MRCQPWPSLVRHRRRRKSTLLVMCSQSSGNTARLSDGRGVLPLAIALGAGANDLYASPFIGFFKVTWPLSLPGVVSGTLLTFIPATGDYINAQLLGSPNQRMIGSVIQSLFTDANNYPAAGALSVILMLLIVTMVLFYVRRAGTEELL